MGCLMEIIGSRGYIDMGIRKEATMEEVMLNHRRRRHREHIFNLIEDEISRCKEKASMEDDIGLWKQKERVFKNKFSTKLTWEMLRSRSEYCEWHKGVWFNYATPKYAFLTWLAIHNRLSTGDKMLSWGGNVNAACSLCDAPIETRNHLFFECRYASNVWENLVRGIMEDDYTNVWQELVMMLSTSQKTIKVFTLKYVFQATIHRLWLERNGRRHGEAPIPPDILIRQIDRIVRNRFSSIRLVEDKKMEGGLRYWFSTRQGF
ncbi:uncharacterized protein LOC108819882 [Raphanus sativus]|uniref:Uncharacterized protein LOC108819882 n=1 Tax=Raphanus sativus TaxID=3726 RepID=A0A6J0KKB7_RAPSA|nr:uncharacterized protein LOC108819882 [Raphanus sativus]